MRLQWTTLILIYLVVIAGSIVRITESGMGCPDWPKCFDQYIPPTDINQLPENYQNYYSSKREEKIKRFSSFLTQIGLEEKAILIQEDKSLLYEQPFNVWNTWLEYINRLIGALAGIFIFASFLKSFFAKEKKALKISLGFSLIILTLFQAWWGSMVVATNIVPWVLTVHMVIAALMIGWQILIISVWKNSLEIIPKKLKIICFFGLIFFLFQIILGTQVRQIVDQWIDYNLREELRLLDFNLFLSHRSLALILIIYSFIIGGFMVLKKIHLIEIYIFFFCVLLEAVVGKILADYNLPIFFQPVHLVLAMICFGCLAGVLVNYKTDSN